MHTMVDGINCVWRFHGSLSEAGEPRPHQKRATTGQFGANYSHDQSGAGKDHFMIARCITRNDISNLGMRGTKICHSSKVLIYTFHDMLNYGCGSNAICHTIEGPVSCRPCPIQCIAEPNENFHASCGGLNLPNIPMHSQCV
jgi:hypothetical protein